MQDVLKEYLVSLGFKVDDASLNSVRKAMGIAEASVAHFASSSITSFAKATTGVLSFVTAATLGLAKFMHSLGQADLDNQIFARQMWMNVDAARAYTNSINALGVSVQDLYLSPELMQKYQELNKLSRGMAVPSGDYESAMKGVRGITFEFQKLKLESTYALQWIGYYLTKYLAGPMGDLKKWLVSVNETIQQKMPVWTAKIAEVASWFVRLGKAAWDIRDAIGAVIGVITAFKLINLVSSPLGALILGMTALLLLVDDFTTFESGGESAFPKLWAWVDKFKKMISDKGYLEDFKRKVGEIVQGVKDFGTWLKSVSESPTFKRYIQDVTRLITILWNGLQTLWGWLQKLYQKMEEKGTLEALGKSLVDIYESVIDLAGAFGDLFGLMGKKGAGDFFAEAFIVALNIVKDTLTSVAGLITIIAGGIKGLSTGDFSMMQKGFKLFSDGIPKGLADAVNGTFGKEIPDPNTFDPKNPYKMIPSHGSTVEPQAIDEYGNIIPTSFKGMQKGIEKMVAMMSYNNPAGGVGNFSAMSYLYPQSNTSHITQVTMKPTYQIYGATQPQAVATAVGGITTAAFTRFFQGGVR